MVLNAANEVAVDAFLGGDLPFTSIPNLIADVMDVRETKGSSIISTLAEVRRLDRWAREYARELIRGLQSR